LTNFYSFNGRGELFERRDVAGRRSRFDYDQAGRLKAEEVFEAGATSPSPGNIRITIKTGS
jgi:YD repeat-containing protein